MIHCVYEPIYIAASVPRRANTGESMPTRHARPIVGQLPPLVNSVKTVEASLRGAKTHNGIKMAKKPKRCRTRTNPSIIGSCFARKVLKTIAKKATAITSRVPYQRS